MNAKRKTPLTRELTVKLDRNTYIVKYPNIGQLMQIESMKMLYSGNAYGSMIRTRTKSSERVLDLIDMVSHLTVLMPELNDDIIGAKSINDLDIVKAQPFLDLYKKQIQPWLEQWDKELNAPIIDNNPISDDELED